MQCDMLCHVISYHVISCHVISYHISCHIISCHIMSCHIISYIMSYHISYHIMPCSVGFCCVGLLCCVVCCVVFVLCCAVLCCRIWSWSPMPCEKHGPRDSVDKNRGRRPRFLSYLRPEGHVFHTAWETMIKSYYSTLADWFFSMFFHINMNFSAFK